jgi:hypothetical protein
MRINQNTMFTLWMMGILFSTMLSGQLQPKFNLTTPVTGADSYQIIVTADADESDQLWISDPITSFPVTYPSSAPPIEYGNVYYSRIIALKNGAIHGIPGNLVLIQTPNITKPVILDGPLFSWGGTEPTSSNYEVTVSPVEDMSNVVWSTTVSGTNAGMPENTFEWGTLYYWNVQGLDGDGNSFGEPSSVSFFNTPSVEPPTLNSPSGEQVATLNPAFSWTSVSQASQYFISVGTNEDLSSPIWGGNVSEVNVTYPEDALSLVRGTTYFWQVVPLDGEGNSFGEEVKSNPSSFQTPDAIQPATLNSPVGEEIPGLIPSFTWSAVEGISKYTLNLAGDEDMSGILWTANIEGTNANYPDNAVALNFGTTYYWVILPLDESDVPFPDAQSSTGSFSTTSMAPIELTDPVNTSIESLLPTFKWEGSESASSYRLDVSESEDFGNLIVSENVSGTEYNSFVGNYDKTYYWRVTPLNSDGVELGNVSNIVMFNTPGLTELSLISPMNATVSNITPLLKWGTLDGASGYLVSVTLEGNVVWSDLVEANEINYPDEPPLNYETTYGWSVQAVDEAVSPLSNKPESGFTTPAFSQVELTSPVGEEVGVVNVQFSWSEVEGAAGYLVEISPNDDLSSSWSSTVSMTNLTYPDDPPFLSGQSYFWRTITVNQDGIPSGAWSDIATFQIAEPPPLVLDDPSGEISTSSPSFGWQEVEGASGYKIQVSSNEDFSDGWESTSGVTNVQYGGDALELNIPYYWKVVVIDQNGNIAGLWSEQLSFQLSTVFVVELTAPMNEDVFSQTPQFSWGSIEGVDKYEINVSSSEDMSELIWSLSEIQDAGTQYPASGSDPLVFGNTYFWTVRPLDGDGNPLADPSAVASFTLSGDLTPELLVPLDTQIDNLTPVFSWSEVSGATKYSILVSSSDDFSELVYQNENIDGTGVTYPTSGAAPLEYGATYFWKIQAWGSDGTSLGDSSPVGLFMTPTGEVEIIVEFED